MIGDFFMFSVVIHQTLWEDESEPLDSCPFVHLVYKLELPFAPYIGLSLLHGKWGCNPIKRVLYHLDDENFLCDIGDVFARNHNDEDDYLKPPLYFEYLVKHHAESGWEVGYTASYPAPI
jgi:hypothetical protein